MNSIQNMLLIQIMVINHNSILMIQHVVYKIQVIIKIHLQTLYPINHLIYLLILLIFIKLIF